MVKGEELKVYNTIKSIAIGSFDGIHIAHKSLIDQVDALVIIERNGGYLTSGYRRSNFTSKMCCFYHFDKIKLLSPQEFVDRVKEDFPNLEKIVVGYDFYFGRAKSANANTLKELFDKEVIVVDEVTIDGISIHSSTIKAYLKNRDIVMVNKLLGRRYTIDGRVISGQGLGKKKLVATLNLIVNDYQLPLDGVYATRTKIDNIWFSSVSFLGHRITTDGSFAVETHILDRDIGIIDGQVSIEFISFIRENRKFKTFEELKECIYLDIDKRRGI